MKILRTRNSYPTYRKWQSMTARCVTPSNTMYPRYGGKGIRVCQAWSNYNPEGFENFDRWLVAELKTLGIGVDDCVLKRRHKDRDYSPENCYVMAKKGVVLPGQTRNDLSDTMVIALRRKAKAWPRPSLAALARAIKLDARTVSNAIRGGTHAHLDSIEPPFKLQP